MVVLDAEILYVEILILDIGYWMLDLTADLFNKGMNVSELKIQHPVSQQPIINFH